MQLTIRKKKMNKYIIIMIIIIPTINTI